MYTFVISHNGEEKARFENQSSDIKVFRFMQTNQSQSISWAIKNEGWEVKQINESTQETTFWN